MSCRTLCRVVWSVVLSRGMRCPWDLMSGDFMAVDILSRVLVLGRFVCAPNLFRKEQKKSCHLFAEL